MNTSHINRRAFAKYAGLGLLGTGGSGWFSDFAARAHASRIAAVAQGRSQKPMSCILLWMSGGPSQMETFDPKPGHENGGPTKAIDTNIPGIQISEHLPQIATVMDSLVPIRSMATKEGDHARATYFLRTGYLPQGPIRYPSMGAFLGKELVTPANELPPYISVAPFRAFAPAAYGPGFLGPSFSPLIVESRMNRAGDSNGDGNGDGDGDGNNGGNANGEQDTTVSFEVQNLKAAAGISREQSDARLQLLTAMEHDFLKDRPGVPGTSHQESYRQAIRMMQSSAVDAFNLDDEEDALRDRYGKHAFGQGCLLARRLVERGVPFVEVSLTGVDGAPGAGWDTHADNFNTVGALCGVLDPAWATLMKDLKDRGLLENTLVVWMGEFGRTPVINNNTGRDHWPGSWSVVLGGGGVKGGQVVGSTAEDGVEITDRKTGVPDLMATICAALHVDHETLNASNVGRPIPLSDHGSSPIEGVVA